jgi:hypothetical protein
MKTSSRIKVLGRTVFFPAGLLGLLKLGFVGLSMSVLVTANAQQVDGSNADEEWRNPTNYGLKMGLAVNSFIAGELQNPRPSVGFMTGVYIERPDKRKSNWGWQTGMDLRLRGGNFANPRILDSVSNSAYSQIGLVTMDFPLLAQYRLSSSGDEKKRNIQFGLQPSLLLQSKLYVGPNKEPFYKDVYLRSWQNLPFTRFDVQGVIGYQFRGYAMGYNVNIKCTVLNMNPRSDNSSDMGGRRFKLPEVDGQGQPAGVLPITGTGKFIGTWCLEFCMVF